MAVHCVSTHVVKVLQTERLVSLLYALPDGTFLAVKVLLPCWLQSLSDGKAETYFQALLATGMELPTKLFKAFRRRQRLVCTDRDAAVLKCEMMVVSALPEMHKAYSVHKAVFGQVRSITEVVKDISLCLHASDGMRTFRAALREVLSARLCYRRGSAPSRRYFLQNRQLLDLFLPPKDATSRLRRAVIMALANGDWLTRGAVVHHCVGPMCCENREACLQKFTTFFVAALAGSAPTTWPYARWLGAEDAIGWVGLIQSMHGLLSLSMCE